MSDKPQHTGNSEKDFIRYASGEMSDRERNAFEKNLQKDPFESEAEEGLSEIGADEFESDLLQLKSRLALKTRSGTRKTFYRAAAGIAVLLAFSSLFYYFLNKNIESGKGPIMVSESTQSPKQEAPAPLNELDKTPVENDLQIQKNANKSAGSGSVLQTEKTMTPPEVLAESRDQYKEDTETMNLKSGQNISQRDESINEMAVFPEAAKSVSGKESPSSRASGKKKISGNVVSSDDYQPVPGVSLALKGSSETTITDSGGRFEIAAPENSDSTLEIEVLHADMEAQDIVVIPDEELHIVMNPSADHIDELAIASMAKEDGKVSRSKSSVNEFHPALPVDGEKSFREYLLKNQVFPKSEISVQKAKVVLEFRVDTNGRPVDIRVNQSPGKEFSDEAVRLLKSGPAWKPAVPVENPTSIEIILEKKNN
ncbi:MAG: carboxypeptidase-like regulatory domain-containing protein [Bacteroidales bacterium]|nr:carboxypeptidase-like regulatory domain-containing protein [Bacteroidales bacterium]MCB8998707.1 carboxypeptidase-like regulatory domain-containing protein [Bacteroidales bacterium]